MNKNKLYTESAFVSLTNGSTFHTKLQEHIQKNLDLSNKGDNQLHDVIDSWKESSDHVCVLCFVGVACNAQA